MTNEKTTLEDAEGPKKGKRKSQTRPRKASSKRIREGQAAGLRVQRAVRAVVVDELLKVGE
jgi:hypothetical protein